MGKRSHDVGGVLRRAEPRGGAASAAAAAGWRGDRIDLADGQKAVAVVDPDVRGCWRAKTVKVQGVGLGEAAVGMGGGA